MTAVEIIILGLLLLLTVAISNGGIMAWVDFWLGSLMVIGGVGKMLFLEDR